MVVVVADDGKGGGRCPDIGNFICCSGTLGTSVWVGDMGYVPTHWEDAERLPPQIGPQVDRVVFKDEYIWDMSKPQWRRWRRRQEYRRWRTKPPISRTGSYNTL